MVVKTKTDIFAVVRKKRKQMDRPDGRPAQLSSWRYYIVFVGAKDSVSCEEVKKHKLQLSHLQRQNCRNCTR